MDRRTFLAKLLAGLGAVVGAGWLWRRGAASGAAGATAPEAAAATSTTSTPTTVTQPPATSQANTTTQATATSQAPTTTTRQATPTTTTGAPTTTQGTTTTDVPAPLLPAGAITVICRDAWGAAPVQGALVEHTIERITIHHTAVRLDDTRSGPARARRHQRFHQRDKGWPDLAYHYLVDRLGVVYEGRPEHARGDTATSYDPTGHFLICLEGDFDRQAPTEAQLRAAAGVAGWAMRRYGLEASTISGHRDHAATTCPGDQVVAVLRDGTFAAAAAASATDPVRTCGAEAEAIVAAIEAGTFTG